MPGMRNSPEEGDVPRVVAALIEEGGRLLICQRKRGGSFELKWEFPGGKLRPGETPREGLLRELREELGATGRVLPAIYRARHRYTEYQSVAQITFFPVRDLHPRPRNRCAEKMIWAPRGDLLRYDFLPADRELVALLARGAFRERDPVRRG